MLLDNKHAYDDGLFCIHETYQQPCNIFTFLTNSIILESSRKYSVSQRQVLYKQKEVPCFQVSKS